MFRKQMKISSVQKYDSQNKYRSKGGLINIVLPSGSTDSFPTTKWALGIATNPPAFLFFSIFMS